MPQGPSAIFILGAHAPLMHCSLLGDVCVPFHRMDARRLLCKDILGNMVGNTLGSCLSDKRIPLQLDFNPRVGFVGMHFTFSDLILFIPLPSQKMVAP
jgi:hypothetical protein